MQQNSPVQTALPAQLVAQTLLQQALPLHVQHQLSQCAMSVGSPTNPGRYVFPQQQPPSSSPSTASPWFQQDLRTTITSLSSNIETLHLSHTSTSMTPTPAVSNPTPRYTPYLIRHYIIQYHTEEKRTTRTY